MRYPSYAQRTSTTLPACGKLQFLKTQSRQRALFTRAPPPPRRQDVSPRQAFDQPSVSSQTNPHATHARKQHLRHTSRAETHDGTPADFIFLSIAPYAHRSLPNTGLMSSFAHRQPPGVSTRFLRIELDLRLCFACRLHPCSFLGGFRTSFTSNTLLFLNQAFLAKPYASSIIIIFSTCFHRIRPLHQPKNPSNPRALHFTQSILSPFFPSTFFGFSALIA